MIAYENKKNLLEYWSIVSLEEGLMHCHKEYELIVCIKGNIKAMINQEEHIIRTGEILVVFPYQAHTYYNTDGGEYRIFIFSSDYLYGVKNLVAQNNVCNYLRSSTICGAIELLDKKYNPEEKTSEMLLVGNINLIMYELIKPLDIKSGNQSFKMEQKIIEYCVKNCNKKISLQSVADELLVSSIKMSKILKDSFGLSFPNFINSLRITNACVLLENPDYNITQVSFEVGFESIRNFNRVFYKMMGESPADYRKKQLKK